MINIDLTALEAVLLTKDEIREVGSVLNAANKSYKCMLSLLDKILRVVRITENNYLESQSLRLEKTIFRRLKEACKLLKDNDTLVVLKFLKDRNDIVGQAAGKLLALA